MIDFGEFGDKSAAKFEHFAVSGELLGCSISWSGAASATALFISLLYSYYLRQHQRKAARRQLVAKMTNKLRHAMICASNVNRSVAAHEILKQAGLDVS